MYRLIFVDADTQTLIENQTELPYSDAIDLARFCSSGNFSLMLLHSQSKTTLDILSRLDSFTQLSKDIASRNAG